MNSAEAVPGVSPECSGRPAASSASCRWALPRDDEIGADESVAQSDEVDDHVDARSPLGAQHGKRGESDTARRSRAGHEREVAFVPDAALRPRSDRLLAAPGIPESSLEHAR